MINGEGRAKQFFVFVAHKLHFQQIINVREWYQTLDIDFKNVVHVACVRCLEVIMTNLVREGFNQPDVREDVSLGSDRGQRALRMPHYSAWIASRWDDPAFPDAFPWFNSVRYWGEQILALREQLAVLEEPPLELE